MSDYCLLLTTSLSSVDNDNEYERKTDDNRYQMINRVYNHENKTILYMLPFFQLTLTKKRRKKNVQGQNFPFGKISLFTSIDCLPRA